MSSFRELGVSERILKAIEELGFEQPMPVQEAVIPYLLEDGSGDVVALAQTGTGKTAAYGIPVIQQTDVDSSEAQFLILSPTRYAFQAKRAALKRQPAYPYSIPIIL